MKLEKCIEDPQFRKAFVEHEVEALQGVIKGNGNIIYHNEGKLSILEQIKTQMTLNDEENSTINEHLTALRSMNKDIEKQGKRLSLMVSIYKRFLTKNEDDKKNGLKLA